MVNTESGRILVVDDDPTVAEVVARYLMRDGYDVDCVADGYAALRVAAESDPDLVVLDLMLPGIDGLEVCRRIRARPDLASLPVIMLTAKGDDVDKIVGLELGADDYLAKPFNPRELLARVRAILRRAQTAPAGGEAHRTFTSGELRIDFDAREVSVDGKRQVLTHFEFELLATLARAAGRVLSREHLMDALKGEEFESFDRSIDVHISKLRAKLEENPKEPRYIRTVRGVGYVLARD